MQLFQHISYEFEYLYQYITPFWGLRLQGTHIDASNPFSSKLMTLTLGEGLWTFFANLALCAPPPSLAVRRSSSSSSKQTRLTQYIEQMRLTTGILALGLTAACLLGQVRLGHRIYAARTRAQRSEQTKERDFLLSICPYGCHVWTKYRLRFFVRVGHETTSIKR